jgi:hypothetical protein
MPISNFTFPSTAAVLLLTAGSALGQPARKLPPQKPLATTQAVIDEHLDALNHCDWKRLVQQYSNDAEFMLPAGQIVKGREEVANLFANFVKPISEGGLCGLKFTPEHTFLVGTTLNVQWVVTGDAVAEPYRGADAYETRNGLMTGQVSTFDAAQVKLKKGAK